MNGSSNWVVFSLIVFLVTGGIFGYTVADANRPLSGQSAAVVYTWPAGVPANVTAFDFNYTFSYQGNGTTSILSVLREVNQTVVYLLGIPVAQGFHVPINITQFGDLRLKGKVISATFSWVIPLAQCDSEHLGLCSRLPLLLFTTTGHETDSVTFEASS